MEGRCLCAIGLRQKRSAGTDETVPLLLAACAQTNPEPPNVTGRPCGSVAQWSRYARVTGASHSRDVCFFVPCDIWWSVSTGSIPGRDIPKS